MFHVFVEGPEDGSPAGLKRLAAGMAAHYGLQIDGFLGRLQAGRFRVKANVDRATAESYVRDLEGLGARCTIEAANAANSRPTPVAFAAVQPPTETAPAPAAKKLPPPRTPGKASVPPPIPAAARGSTAPPPVAGAPAPAPPTAGYPRPSTPPPVAGQYQSGLSAAFSGDTPAGGLGALERESASFSLSSVDGADDGTGDAAERSYEPAASALPASIGPAPEKPPAKAPAKAKPKDEPLDMFAPPDAQGDEFKVELAADEVAISARKRVSTPPANEVVAPPAQGGTSPAMRRSQPSIPIPNASVEGVTRMRSKLGPLAEPRVRTVTGVVLAILLGFLPAHLFARSRERSEFKAIDEKVVSLQIAADTPEAYEGLDRIRDDQLERKRDARRNITLIAFVIWAAFGGGVGYAWFRRIPWDQLE